MLNNWFESRNLRILGYQSEAISKVQKSFNEREITVLAACPSAGKTLMTIYIIEEYLNQHPNHKIMVLAHGTTILRTQFYDVLKEINPNFSYNLVEKFTQYDINADVNVCLPQTLTGNVLDKIDMLVVDEAHQFYFAEKMMKDIIKQTKPNKQLLLTGTPSPFIRKGFDIIPVTLNTVFDEGMISDLYVEIATSSYSFDPMYDFNQDDELKTNIYIKESETKKTLDDLVAKIVDRLKSIKGNDYQNLLPEWLPTLKRLQKTMIACRSQHQAMQVKHYFDKIGIKSSLSISDVDLDSSEIERFKNEQDCLILIVVGRGILGFNYPELVNVVDMTTSQNVDRIYQLLCRVIRKHPEGQKKLFFKVAPNIHSDYYKYIMTAVLSLSDESFFTKFNGKNFSDMIIPVIKTTIKKENDVSNIDDNKNKSKPKTLKPVDFEGLPVFEFFKDLYHKKDALLNVYAYTTIRDVHGEFLNWMPNNYWTKEKCIESALKYKTVRDWMKFGGGAYNAARRNGWYDECTMHIIKIYWTKEKCIESASKFKTIKEWKNNESTAYSVACTKGWKDECISHMIKLNNVKHPKGYWTKEKIIKSAKGYNTPKDWFKNYSGAYSIARKMSYYEEATSHMIKPTIWTKEKCIIDAKQYSSRKDWERNNPSAVHAARKNKWIDECCFHMKAKLNNWTKEMCIESASKYNNRIEWYKNDGKSYQAALKYNWMNDCTKHMIKLHQLWTKEMCIESALKYNKIRDWETHERNACSAARRNGWMDDCTQHMIIGKNAGYWTLDTCIKDARQYKKPSEWKKNNSTAYNKAMKNGWLNECTAHMKVRTKSKDECIKIAKKYNNKKEWRENDKSTYIAALRYKWMEECTTHMKK